MICHDLKCIFIHIPRCAGSSVEYWLHGRDWWLTDPASKHLTARQAQRLYAPYWDDYFTFSIVRAPVARCLSSLKYASHFGLTETRGEIDFSGYLARFGDPVTVEYDYRFHPAVAVRHPEQRSGAVYGNILDAPLDFVARFENLVDDMERVRRQLGLRRAFDIHAERAAAPPPVPGAATRTMIERLYARDHADFGY